VTRPIYIHFRLTRLATARPNKAPRRGIPFGHDVFDVYPVTLRVRGERPPTRFTQTLPCTAPRWAAQHRSGLGKAQVRGLTEGSDSDGSGTKWKR
jgi:hypothetical protein